MFSVFGFGLLSDFELRPSAFEMEREKFTNVEKMVRDRGFEPLTPSVSRKCSTTELTAQPWLNNPERSNLYRSFAETREV